MVKLHLPNAKHQPGGWLAPPPYIAVHLPNAKHQPFRAPAVDGQH